MKELDEIIKQLRELGVSNAEIKKMKDNFDAVRKSGGDVEKQLDLMRNKVDKVREAQEFANETFSDLTQILQANLAELNNNDSAVKRSLKARRGVRDISRELLNDEEGIRQLSEKELKDRVAKLEAKKKELELEKEAVKNKYTDIDLRKSQDSITDEILKKNYGTVEVSKAKREEAFNEASILKNNLSLEEGILQKAKARLEQEEEINKKLGLSGSLVKSLGGAMGKLGLDSKIVADALEEAEESMREAAKDANNMFPAMAGLGPLAKGFGKALTDPLTIISAIGKGFLAVNKAQVESIRLTGSAATSMAGFSGKVAATSEVLEVAAAATRQLGLDANAVFGNELLTSVTYLQHELGLTADQAARFGSISVLTGKTTKDINKDISAGASEMNKLAKSGVPLGIVLQDVLNASDDITASLGNNPKAIAKAATAARALGMDLAKVNNIADGLLDFESSIEAELEAQLLTGKNINLSKARELALNNDLEGVARELANQGASAAEFANMNRIQQNAMAKAMGMSREELGKMVMTQAQSASLSDEQRAKIQGVTVEQLKQEDVMHRLNRALMMLGESFAPMLEIAASFVSVLVKPISLLAGGISMIFDFFDKLTKDSGTFINQLTKFAVGGTLLLIGKSIKDAFSPSVTGGFFKNLKANFDPKNFGLKNLKEKVTGLFSKDGAGKITKDAQGRFRDAKGRFAKNPMSKTMDKGAEATGKVKDKTKGANKAQGPGGFLKSLAEGLREMGTDFGKIMKGTLALGLAAVAVVGPFALALRTIKDVDPAVIAAFSLGVGVLGGSLALLGKMSGNVIKGGIALAAAGAGILAASFGFSLLEGINPDVVKAVVGSLLVLGTGAALLGALAGNIMTGAAALGILGLAMVPAAFALSLLENVDISKITAFSIALPLLGLAAAGLGFLAPFIMAGAAALAVLGAAMIPAAIAFNIMAKADLEKIGTGLTAIASVGPQLALAGAGMVALAGGAAILGFASPMLLLAGGALTVLGMAAQLASNANIEGIANQLTQLGRIGPGLVAAGMGIFAIAGGLTAFALAMAGASVVSGLTSLFGGGVMGDLEALAAMAGPLSQVGVSLTAIAAGLSGIALALSTLETEKINELKGLVMTTAMAAPMVAASGAITELISGITGGGEDSSNAALEAKLDELIAAVKEGGDVFIDGNKAGNAMLLSSYKSS